MPKCQIRLSITARHATQLLHAELICHGWILSYGSGTDFEFWTDQKMNKYFGMWLPRSSARGLTDKYPSQDAIIIPLHFIFADGYIDAG